MNGLKSEEFVTIGKVRKGRKSSSQEEKKAWQNVLRKNGRESLEEQ